jgi:hypothetical protein
VLTAPSAVSSIIPAPPTAQSSADAASRVTDAASSVWSIGPRSAALTASSTRPTDNPGDAARSASNP